MGSYLLRNSTLRLPVRAVVMVLVVTALALAAFMLVTKPAQAATTFTVTKTDDTNDGACTADDCSLREAIIAANNDASGPDTINVPAGTYTLTRGGNDGGSDPGPNPNIGDLDITASMTIKGDSQGGTTVQAGDTAYNGIDRVFEIWNSSTTANITDMTIKNGNTGGGYYVDFGGGVRNNGASLDLKRVTVSNNRASCTGGGIANYMGGSLKLEDSTVSDNDNSGPNGCNGGLGGGISNIKSRGSSDGTTATITGSTIKNNRSAYGGGIESGLPGPASLTMENSTLSGNSATSEGGGLYSDNTSSLTNVTLDDNSAPTGGGVRVNSGTSTVKNAIIADSSSGGDCSGAISATGPNIVEDPTGCSIGGTATTISADPKLGPLQNNGGPTETHALQAGSPAIDAGDSTGAPSTDQRGVSRPQDGNADGTAAYDIGAFELKPPVADAQSVTTDEDTSKTITLTGTAGDGGDLTFEVTGRPANGALSDPGKPTCSGTAPNRTCSVDVTYTPNKDFNGTDSFTYKAKDANTESSPATVTITVNAVNDAPVAKDDSATTDEDTATTPIDVLSNDTDVDGDTLSVGTFTNGSHGTVTKSTDGTKLIYTPEKDFNGTDTFTYKATDGSLNSNDATVTVKVNPVNDPPDAKDDSVSTMEDTPVTIPVLDNDSDVDKDTLTVTKVSDPAHGTATINSADNTIKYQPAANFNGPDSFQYTVSDGNGGTATATVSINVVPVNDAPIANDDAYSTDEGQTLTTKAPGVLLNDVDAEGDKLVARVVLNPKSGTLTFNPDGSFSYEPGANFSGTDSFTYKASDGTNESNEATVTITVKPVNGPPSNPPPPPPVSGPPSNPPPPSEHKHHKHNHHHKGAHKQHKPGGGNSGGECGGICQ